MGLSTRIRKAKIAYHGRFGRISVPERWVFLMGTTNSGTTLLKAVLATHPQVASMHREGQHYTDVFFKAGRYKRLWALAEGTEMLEDDTRADPDRLKRQWCGQLNDRRRPIYLEKSPPNSLRTRWLQRHFEHAHFIGIVRDGYAIAEGIRRRTGHPIELAARQWAVCNEVMLRDFEHLEHKLLLRYEAFTEAPGEGFGEICAFLGIDPGRTDYLSQSWKVQDKRSEIQNMNARSHRSLTPEDRRLIEQEAGPMLERLGYPWREPAAAEG